MKSNSSFGNWLKQRRKALDLTQQDLADQVSYSVVTIRKIERDITRPSKLMAERLADVLAVAPDERSIFMNFARRVADSRPGLPTDETLFTPVHNLPLQSTAFLGRENELAQIAERLNDPTCRLLTLIGPGGIGKTRLALQAALRQAEEYADGVYFVSLAPVGSPMLIAAAIASALEISFYGQQEPNAQVVTYLHGKHLLLVMDNYEHLLPEITLLNDLLANVPRLKMLVTSRERLNMQEEWTLLVEGLPFPNRMTNDDVGSYTAVQLFVQRARQMQANFSLKEQADAVVEICRAVEGMPLGIELAASWLRAMTCQQIADQIQQDVDFLVTPLRDVPERHRSLRKLFEHSWALLSLAERNALMKLSVFRGGIDPEAAEQVAEASLLVLAGLVDKSLVRLNPSGRYELHELLRQFVADKLAAAGEVESTSIRHLGYFVNLAEKAEAQLNTSEQVDWLDRLDLEHDNLRAALTWSLSGGEAETGLHLAGALGWFWQLRTHRSEGRQWYATLLAVNHSAPAFLRAKALHLAVEMDGRDFDQRRVLGEEALQLARAAGDKWNAAWSLAALGFLAWKFAVDEERAIAELEEALVLFREIGDQWGLGHALRRLSMVLINQGKYEQAIVLATEALDLAYRAGSKSSIVETLDILNTAEWRFGEDLSRVVARAREYLPLLREMGYTWLVSKTLGWLALLSLNLQDDIQARIYIEECLRLKGQENVIKMGVVISLLVSGILAVKQGKSSQAAKIFGAAEVHFGASSGYGVYIDFERQLAAAREQVEGAGFAAAFAEGQMMTFEQAMAYALDHATHPF